jgi:predicted nucleic acid-binding protein
MSRGERIVFVTEPPAKYLARPPIVIDCSMLCAVLFDESERVDAERALAGRRLIAPCLLDHELLNVAIKKRRRGMPASVVERALADYAEQGIELLDTDVKAQYVLALRHNLSGYDAAYLWLAAELKTPLATFDRKLAQAAREHLGGLE